MDNAHAAPAALKAVGEKAGQRRLGLVHPQAMQVKCPLGLDHPALQVTEDPVLYPRAAELEKLPGFYRQIGEILGDLVAHRQVEWDRTPPPVIRVGIRSLDRLDVGHGLTESRVVIVGVVIMLAHERIEAGSPIQIKMRRRGVCSIICRLEPVCCGGRYLLWNACESCSAMMMATRHRG